MNRKANVAQRHAKRTVALTVIIGLFWLVQFPAISAAERAQLSNRFHFTRIALPGIPNQNYRSARAVNPSLEHISAWISSVGAAVALHDLDGDGLPNDVCYVETRTNQVIVAPVPGTGTRYEPFTLDVTSLPYNSSTMAPMGCLPGDFDEDSTPDILVYYWGRTPVIFLHRQGSEFSSSHFSSNSFVQRELVTDGGRWFTNAVTAADLDGDGHVDLIVGNYFPDDAQILDSQATNKEQMQASMSRAYNGGNKHFLLWQNATTGAEPTVQFKDVPGILDEEVDRGWTLAIGAADLDGDLLPEIYFANDFGPDRLLHNLSKPGELHFALLSGETSLMTPGSKVLGHDSFKGMGVDFGDLSGNGLLDIFVSNITSSYALEESNFAFINTGNVEQMRQGTAPFIDRSEPLGLSRSGWAWDAKLADFDNDGTLEIVQATGFVKGQINRWPELHELAMGNDELLSNPQDWPRFQAGDDLSGHEHNPFYVRASNGRYYDLATDLGIDTTEVSRGIAVADVDGNGCLSFAVANQWEPSYFYHNDCPNPGTFLGLHLLLPVNTFSKEVQVQTGHPGADMRGRPAIGAEATIYFPDGRKLVAQVDGGNGHSGKRSPDLHFGLGATPRDAQVRVDLHWRGTTGRVYRKTIYLAPGWHTIMLAAQD